MKKRTVSLILMLLTTAVLSLLVVTLTGAQAPDGTGVGPADTGGPDGAGYTWTDSKLPAPTVAFDWDEIAITGTLPLGTKAPMASTHENRGDFDIPIGFPFVFYGDVVERISIASNGFLTFRDRDVEDWTDECPPDTNDPDDAIYALWDHLDSSAAGYGDIYYQTIGTEPNRRFIVQYDEIQRWGTTDLETFEVILYEGSNQIKLQYQDMQGWSGNGGWSTVAIEQIGATTALTYCCNNAYYIHNGLAISITPPYTVALQPTSYQGYGAPGQQMRYDLTVFNNTGDNESFDLKLSGNVWPTTLSAINTGMIDKDGDRSFKLTVQIPSNARPCDKDTVTVAVTSKTNSPGTYAKKATFVTTASAGVLAYVTNFGEEFYGRGSLSVVHVGGGGYCELKRIPVGMDAEGVVFSSGTSRIFVANEDDPSVSIINALTEELRSGRASIGLGEAAYNETHGLVLSPDGNKLYATSFSSHRIYAIDTRTLLVDWYVTDDSTDSAHYDPDMGTVWRLAITPNGNKLYATSLNTGSMLRVIDTATQSVTRIDTGINQLAGVAVNPDGTQAYVVSKSDNRVAVIDTATDAVVATIPLSAGGGWDVVFSPSGDKAYVSRGSGRYAGYADFISIIDTTTRTEIGTIATSPNPSGLAISEDGRYLYVVNNRASSVSVFDTSTRILLGSATVGERPNYIALKPSPSIHLPIIMQNYQ